MRTAKEYTDYKKVYFKPDVECCPICLSKLQFDHWVIDKYVNTLDGVLRVKSDAKVCSDDECKKENGKINYRSSTVHQYPLPRSSFGLDLIAYVGFQRLKAHQNFDEIHKDLVKKEVCVSRRSVDNLYNSFEYLMKCSLPKRLKELEEKFKQNNGIILSIDGLQPQLGHEILFVLRDVTTEEVLHAEMMKSTDTESMVRLFEIIKTSGIMVAGIVSDAQHSIRKAIGIVFPDVPYQLCKYHYLKDFGAPVGVADAELKKEVKKNFVESEK
jgi:hypothetical protein